jgi:hypothetical protein
MTKLVAYKDGVVLPNITFLKNLELDSSASVVVTCNSMVGFTMIIACLNTSCYALNLMDALLANQHDTESGEVWGDDFDCWDVSDCLGNIDDAFYVFDSNLHGMSYICCV